MTPRSIGLPSVPSRRLPRYAPRLGPQLRLRLCPRGDGTGGVDGVWWPRTQDLVAEVPGLFTVLRPHLGPVWRVVYDPAGWSPSARRLQFGSRAVRLDPYPFELFNTMYVCSVYDIAVVLRVIASTTNSSKANAALAAVPGTRNAGRS
ncbi:DUF5994 family protein [Nocardia rhamnosiphila]|uniref:DUF5994 family protein n=1 Tax=Nocardia rhamnosiphila TaxID=426716 RepID=UPI0033F6DBD6